MPFINYIGSLTIPSGSTVSSTHLTQSGYGKYDAIGIFAPPSMSGGAIIQGAYDYSASVYGSGSVWYDVQSPAGTNVVVSGSKVICLESFPYDAIRLSGSIQDSVSGSNFIFTGQIMGAVTNQAVLLP